MEAAEEFNARPGAFIMRKDRTTMKETRRTVVRAACARKKEVENKLCTRNEIPFLSFVGPEDLYYD
jgi:hypothetical protein